MRKGGRVGHRQGGCRPEATADAGRRRRAPRRDDEQVAAQRRDPVAHLDLRALTETDGEDDGGDADEDAEHRQDRPQAVRAHGLEAGAQRLEPAHACAETDDEVGCLELAVADPHDPAGRIGDGVLVGDQHDRATRGMQLVEQREQVLGGPRVEVAGRLVGEQQGGIRDQRAGNRDALLLAAGQLAGSVLDAVGEADPIECGKRPDLPLGATDAGVAQRQLDVAQGGHRGQQVELLEDKPDALVAHQRELHLRHAADVGAGEPVACRPTVCRDSQGCASGSTCPTRTGP